MSFESRRYPVLTAADLFLEPFVHFSTSLSSRGKYANPFNPRTTIRYGLPAGSRVTLTLYNTLGKKAATPVDEYEEAGYHAVRVDGTGLPSGVSYYRVRAGGITLTRRCLLLK